LRQFIFGSSGLAASGAVALDNMTVTNLAPVPESASVAAVLGALALVSIAFHRRRK
jgi:MYXO-CTERM domain-containing protein